MLSLVSMFRHLFIFRQGKIIWINIKFWEQHALFKIKINEYKLNANIRWCKQIQNDITEIFGAIDAFKTDTLMQKEQQFDTLKGWSK